MDRCLDISFWLTVTHSQGHDYSHTRATDELTAVVLTAALQSQQPVTPRCHHSKQYRFANILLCSADHIQWRVQHDGR